jgi:hypothetical protein
MVAGCRNKRKISIPLRTDIQFSQLLQLKMSLGRTFKLRTGAEIPALGFGTFANEGAKGETYKAVMCALRTGYRYISLLPSDCDT